MKKPTNEPILEYRQGSKERIALEEALKKYSQMTTEVPVVIGGQELKGEKEVYQTWVSFLIARTCS